MNTNVPSLDSELIVKPLNERELLHLEGSLKVEELTDEEITKLLDENTISKCSCPQDTPKQK